MVTPLAPWTLKILEILSDGEWHDREALYKASAPLVTEERASRYDGADPQRDVISTILAGLKYKGLVESQDNKRSTPLRITDHGIYALQRERGEVQENMHRGQWSPMSKKMWAILADGRKHDYKDLVLQVSYVVPPERAYRSQRAVLEREGQLETAGSHGGDIYRTGAKRIATAIVRGFAKRGRIVIEDGKVWMADGTR